MKKTWKEIVLNKLGYTEITYSDKLGNSFTKVRSIKKVQEETRKAILAYDDDSTLAVLREKANLPVVGPMSEESHKAIITPEDVAKATFKEIVANEEREVVTAKPYKKRNGSRAKRVRSASN